MEFREYRPGDELESGPVGLHQPASSAVPVDLGHIDVVLLPAVAVDDSGTRLGRGAGYYDRALAGIVSSPTLVAVVHDLQVVDSLDRRPWDVPVDAVVTDLRWWRVR